MPLKYLQEFFYSFNKKKFVNKGCYKLYSFRNKKLILKRQQKSRLEFVHMLRY
ncbi:Uncharacterized protein dnl_49560 [Desulfonema limicola]|uniref:Uncharacterized protein n=1 Tax=Desulfonema limicola TaxID=45656 RepID=A0A975BBF3_9BACT|nr:Uncharacterized protein dnl_49560 [Desulfonema limicola]